MLESHANNTTANNHFVRLDQVKWQILHARSTECKSSVRRSWTHRVLWEKVWYQHYRVVATLHATYVEKCMCVTNIHLYTNTGYCPQINICLSHIYIYTCVLLRDKWKLSHVIFDHFLSHIFTCTTVGKLWPISAQETQALYSIIIRFACQRALCGKCSGQWTQTC